MAKARVVSLINMKGGVGKSTLTANLAWFFAERYEKPKRVLVIDLDPQFNVSQYLLGPYQYERLHRENHPTVWDIFEHKTKVPHAENHRFNTEDLICKSAFSFGTGCVHLIMSRLELCFSLESPGNKETYLNKVIEEVVPQYDLILIDCAPTESFLTKAAYHASDYLLIPVRPEYLSAIGLTLLTESLANFRERNGFKPKIAGVLINAYSGYRPEHRTSIAEIRSTAEKNKWYFFESQMKESKSYPHSARDGMPVFRTSHVRQETVANLTEIGNELARRIKL